MQAISESGASSKPMLWLSYILSYVPALFLLMGSAMNIVKPAFVVESTTKMGYSESVIMPIGIALLISTILYLIPRTSVLGTILLTGYLGGAVNTHVHADDGIGLILFPVIFATLLWGGLYLRDARLRALLPIKS